MKSLKVPTSVTAIWIFISRITLAAVALLMLGGRDALAEAPTFAGKTIPLEQISEVVGKQYAGDGLAVNATPQGAQLRCSFQRLTGKATPEGLALSSTVEGANGDEFRVVANALGRGSHPNLMPLPPIGTIAVTDKLVRFIRPGLVEEYTVSMDGVRQDFVVLEKPAALSSQLSTLNQSALRVELAVSGAKVEPCADGAQLVLEKSGRKISYNRLRVTDAMGKELQARMEVTNESEIRGSESQSGLAVVVDDTDALYPVRIDPTF